MLFWNRTRDLGKECESEYADMHTRAAQTSAAQPTRSPERQVRQLMLHAFINHLLLVV